jgi:PAS domain S-box-containing protein
MSARAAGRLTRKRAVRPPAAAPDTPVSQLINWLPEVVYWRRLRPTPELLYINDAITALTGYPPSHFLSQGPEMFPAHPSDQRRLTAFAKNLSRTATSMTCRLVRLDGVMVWVEFQRRLIDGPDGEPEMAVGLIRKIEAPGRARPKAAHVAAQFERLSELAPIGLAQVSLDGRFQWVNRRFCEVANYSRAELLKRTEPDLLHPQDRDRHAALIRKVIAGELPRCTLEVRYRRADGSHVWVTVTATLMRTSRGRATHLVTTLAELPGGRRPPETDEVGLVQYGPVLVDFERLRVQIDGRELRFTVKELTVLWYLIQNRGQVLSRDRLLADVWGYRHTAESRTVDVHICRLRRKSPFLAEAIVTVDRSGYRLMNPPPAYPKPSPEP